MPIDHKDRLGEKLRDVEKGREDDYFARRDRELLQKLKAETASQQQQTLRELAHMRCPKCGEHLQTREYLGVSIEQCPAGHGIWLDQGELEQIAAREKTGWLARFLGR